MVVVCVCLSLRVCVCGCVAWGGLVGGKGGAGWPGQRLINAVRRLMCCLKAAQWISMLGGLHTLTAAAHSTGSSGCGAVRMAMAKAGAVRRAAPTPGAAAQKDAKKGGQPSGQAQRGLPAAALQATQGVTTGGGAM